LPKGVVTTHQNIQSQIATLVSAWKWSDKDHTLCILPLHHVHGLINVVSCSLWAGAICEFLPEFDARKVFEILIEQRVNVFMAVPTIYFKLITHWESLPIAEQEKISSELTLFRLMVSGSAALPATVMGKWKIISNHTLLERYGMTELGMAISNPYEGERRTGFVGKPLPGVSIRLANETDEEVHGEPGEIQVKGQNVFLEYWNKEEATKNSFTQDGWFKTGDIAFEENGYYRIMGRNSVDIIKSGGYKISALEIEETLRTHPNVKDCAIVGIDDEEWGEIVAAAIVSSVDPLDIDLLRTWLKEQLPPYRVPRKFIVVKELPRNAMGKVTKNDIKKWF
jgi:malonyl-CoA/methylmalonyl-CoA synthetase